jgi:tetratricopeptide (TPR) repeat protein
MIDTLFIINLQRRADKLQDVLKPIEKLQINKEKYKIYPAIDCKDFTSVKEMVKKYQNIEFNPAIFKKEDICNRLLAVDHCHITKKIRGLLCTNCKMALGKFQDSIEYLKKAVEYMERDYVVPVVKDSIKRIDHNDRPNWKILVTTPDGLFPSLQHAANHYKVHHTSIRSWCILDSKWKKEGFSSQKMFISLNQLKEYCNAQNQSI